MRIAGHALLCLFLKSVSALAIEGQVVDRDGNPIADASVSILGLSGSVRTDMQGRFTWSPDPDPPFEILVVLSDGSYMAPSFIEEIPADAPLIITVEPVYSESLTVATAVTPNIEAPPASGMTTLAERDLERRSPSRLSDALQNIPGVSTLSEYHAAVPSIRGLARGRTLILIDGGRVTTERRAGPSASYIDPFFLEGVEVSRGPGSVAYGSDAFGGIIHARTRRPTLGEPFRFRFQGTLGAGLPEQSARLEMSSAVAGGAVLAQGRFRDFGDYESARGEVDNSAASDRGFAFRWLSETGPGLFSIGWQSDFSRSVGRPSSRNPVLRVFYPEETSHRFSIGYDADPRWGFSRLKVEGFVGGYKLVTDRDSLPTAEDPRLIQQADVSAMDYSFRGVATRPVGPGRIEFGVDLNGRFGLEAFDRLFQFDADDRLVSTDESLAVEDSRRDDVGLYMSGESSLGRFLTAGGGVRYDRITTSNEGGSIGDFETSNDAFSGFASLTANLAPGLNLAGQVARGFRDPTLSDRYFQGISGRGFVTGNPFLQPEESFQIDVALRHTTSSYRWGVFFYDYRIDDLIERFEPEDDQFEFRNRGRARIRGLEVEFQSSIGSGFVLDIGAQVATGETDDDDSPLADIPARSLTLVLTRPVLERGYFQFRSAFFARDDDPGPTEIVVPGYATFDTGFGWKLGPSYELRFLVRNLFDKDYPVSPDRRAIAAPGRSGLVTLVVEM